MTHELREATSSSQWKEGGPTSKEKCRKLITSPCRIYRNSSNIKLKFFGSRKKTTTQTHHLAWFKFRPDLGHIVVDDTGILCHVQLEQVVVYQPKRNHSDHLTCCFGKFQGVVGGVPFQILICILNSAKRVWFCTLKHIRNMMTTYI